MLMNMKKNNKKLKIFVSMVETYANTNEIELLRKMVENYIDEWDLKKCSTLAGRCQKII